jgi:hypothetical protein
MVNSPNVVNKHQNTFIREMLFQTGSLGSISGIQGISTSFGKIAKE